MQVLDGAWQSDADGQVHEPAEGSPKENGPGLDQRGTSAAGDATDRQHSDGTRGVQRSAVLVTGLLFDLTWRAQSREVVVAGGSCCSQSMGKRRTTTCRWLLSLIYSRTDNVKVNL